MSAEQNKRILRIIKGGELNLQVSNDICCEQSFMNPAYRQATRALMQILHQTKSFHAGMRSPLCDSEENIGSRLFQYSGNVIAFMAKRGGGKTRTMLSFSHVLENPQEKIACPGSHNECDGCNNSFLKEPDRNWLKRCSFIALPPIAPSSLEGQQNILYVVLSRLYRYADRLLRPDRMCDRVTEREKNELFQSFHNCLSGINGIKHPSKEALEDLSALQDISDGLALRKHFYTLVQQLLKIAAPRDSITDKFLILQIDDADSQIKNGYDVLEDVRKYLVIPNLVILMSAELDFLHNVILQDHLHKFPDLKNVPEINLSNELSRITRKYIDKLIPPSHMVHLPQMDKIVEVSSDQLILQYVNNEDSKEENELTWAEEGDWNFQTTLLMLIYRKTGVAFVAPNSYLHNIIPRTLRGLNQLIFLLAKMEDIPPIRDGESRSGIDLATAILKQLPFAEDNLSRFTDYFVNDWLDAKISNLADRMFLKQFSKAVSSNRTRLAFKYLLSKYNQPEPLFEYYDRYSLDILMTTIGQTNRTQDDFLLLFSIRTLFTLESHRLILWHKRVVVQKYISQHKETLEEKKIPNLPLLVFDYNPDIIHIPKFFRAGKKAKGIQEFPIYLDTASQYSYQPAPIEKQFSINEFNAVVNHIQTSVSPSELKHVIDFFGIYGPGNYTLSLVNIIIPILRLGSLPKKQTEYQRDIFQMQESALLIAANWDVQWDLYVNMALNGEPTDDNIPPSIGIGSIVNAINTVLGKINNGTLVAYNDNIKNGFCELKVAVPAWQDIAWYAKIAASLLLPFEGPSQKKENTTKPVKTRITPPKEGILSQDDKVLDSPIGNRSEHHNLLADAEETLPKIGGTASLPE